MYSTDYRLNFSKDLWFHRVPIESIHFIREKGSLPGKAGDVSMRSPNYYSALQNPIFSILGTWLEF